MKYLNRKFWKDVYELWPQFVSVFVMAMLSIAIYAGMSAVWTGMQQTYDKYRDDSNLPMPMEWTPVITPIHMVLIIGVIVLFSALINITVCMKIKEINMVEALKGAE